MENKKSATAVEWLLEELPKVYVEHRHLVIEQANKMFEQQIIDALHYFGIENAEQYYNQTFKK
jgi:hypothetical protein